MPHLVGVKHAASDLDYVTDLLLHVGEELRIFCGLESYSYPVLAVGGAGLMSAVGNLFPREVAMLAECGLAPEEVRQPLAPLDEPTRTRVLAALEAYRHPAPRA